MFVLAQAEDLGLAEALARAVEMHDLEVEGFVALRSAASAVKAANSSRTRA